MPPIQTARVSVVRNPLDACGREILPVAIGARVCDLVIAHSQEMRGLETIVTLNGRTIENARACEIEVRDGDMLVICARIKGGGSKDAIRVVAMIAVMAAAVYTGGMAAGAYGAFAGALTSAAVGVGGALLINAMLPQQKPKMAGMDDLSLGNNYGWTPAENLVAEGLTIPILYGTMRVAPMVVSKYVTSDGETQFLNVLYGICEGEIATIDTSKIQINDNALANYSGVTVATTTGSNTQTAVAGFQRTAAEKAIGTEMTGNTYVTDATQGNAVQSIGYGFVFPQGLCTVSGNSFGEHSVTIQMQYKLTTAPTWTTAASVAVTGNSMGVLRKYYEYAVAAGEYDVRAAVTTARQTGAEFLEKVHFEFLQEYVNDVFTYPNTALLGIKALASDQLNGMAPRVTVVVEKATVAVWTGAAYENKPANNPAWACYDLLHNGRYGAGIPYARLTYADFSAWAAFCVTNSYTCNIYLETASSLTDAMSKIGTVGRGSVVQRGTNFGAMFDGVASPVQMFTTGNIVADSFEETYLDRQNRSDVIEVTFLDAANDYQRRTIEIARTDYDASTTEIRMSQISLEACTSWQQAANYGKFMMNCQEYLMRTISFKTDVDAIACQPGDIISVQHDVPQWGYGGRVASATASTIVLDQSVLVEAGETYMAQIRHSGTDVLEERILITPAPGMHTSFQLDPGYFANWANTPTKGDIYAWGKFAVQTKDFRVLSIKRSGDMLCQITAMEYRADVYSDGATIPEYPVESDLPQVAGVRADDIYPVGPDGEMRAPVIDVTWRGFAVLWNVFVKESVENIWRKVGNTNRTQYRVTGVDIGKTYTVAVSTTDNPEDGDSDTVTMTIDPPEAVTNLTAEIIDNFVLLKWKPPESELPISHYVITKGAAFATSQAVGRADKSFTTVFELLPGTYTYWVYAVNTAGDVGTEASVTVVLTLSTDYKFQAEVSSTLNGTRDDIILEPGMLVGPLDDAETWTEHFIAHAQTTMAGFNTAGYTYYFEPNYELTGHYIEGVIDLGATINKGDIALTPTWYVLTGDETKVNLYPTISTSPDNVSWTDYAGSWNASGAGFRYVKYRIDVTTDGAVIAITALKLSTVLRKIRETGTDEVVVAGTGKTVTFTQAFVDVDSIVCTARSSAGAPKIAVYDFTDAPNPTTFTVYILDDAGTKTTGTFSYAIEGV